MSPSPKQLNQRVYEEQKVWGTEGNDRFFEEKRSRPEDLYRSEKFFLPDVLKQVDECLDVGCACGGFSEIMKSFNPSLQYTGVDIIESFIEKASIKYPQSRFYVADGTDLNFSDNSFPLVHSSGIMHLISAYREMTEEMYRVASRYLLCDFRLTQEDDVTGQMDANLLGQNKCDQPLPYFVLNKDKHIAFLESLNPKPATIKVRGYAHAPTKSAKIGLDKILMAFFLIEKGHPDNKKTKIEIDLDL